MTAFPRSKHFFRTPKGLLLPILLLLASLAGIHAGVRHAAPGLLGAIGAAMLVDIAIVRLWRGAWFFHSGALLSGLIVALILSVTEPWYVPAITAALAVASKYIFRTRRGHIFNPAALALVAAYYSGPRNLDSAEASLFVMDCKHAETVFSHLQSTGCPRTPQRGEVGRATRHRVWRPSHPTRQVEGDRPPRPAQPLRGALRSWRAQDGA